MKNNRTLIILFTIGLLIQFACANATMAQGKLGRIRDSVRENHSSDSHDDEDPHSEHSHDYDNHDHDYHDDHRHRDSHDSIGLGWIGLQCDWPCDRPCDVYESCPPVARPVIVAQGATQAPVYESVVSVWTPPQFVDWSARMTGFGGTDFDDISQGGLGLLLQQPGGVGLDLSVSMFRESGATFRDHLWFGDLNLVKEVAVDRLRARMGFGLNWMGDSIGGEAGVNLTAGIDLKLSERWIFASEIDFGTLGDTDLFHTQLSLGRKFDVAEFVFGYDHFDVGGTTLGGAFAGLRFRF